MIDQRNNNPVAVTGTPTLVTGALTMDTNQGLLFNGPTSFAQATDSVSLSMTGSMSLEFFFKFSALPGATRDIVSKASSYAAQLNTSGKLLFRVDNGASNVTVTSVQTLAINTWYHVVCVLNQEYAGAEQFGDTSVGASGTNLDDDNGNNKISGLFTLPEPAILDAVTVFLRYYDESLWFVQTKAHVYSDSAATPDDLITESELVTIQPASPDVEYVTFNPLTYPLAPVVVPDGDYWIGFTTDTVGGVPKSVFQMAYTAAAGTRAKRPDSVSSPSDPWGSVTSAGTEELSIYCDYTAIARTGQEGKAAVYINGVLDNSASYALGIADNANALQISPSAAFNVDEVSVWDRVLSPLEVATHYLAH